MIRAKGFKVLSGWQGELVYGDLAHRYIFAWGVRSRRGPSRAWLSAHTASWIIGLSAALRDSESCLNVLGWFE